MRCNGYQISDNHNAKRKETSERIEKTGSGMWTSVWNPSSPECFLLPPARLIVLILHNVSCRQDCFWVIPKDLLFLGIRKEHNFTITGFPQEKWRCQKGIKDSSRPEDWRRFLSLQEHPKGENITESGTTEHNLDVLLEQQALLELVQVEDESEFGVVASFSIPNYYSTPFATSTQLCLNLLLTCLFFSVSVPRPFNFNLLEPRCCCSSREDPQRLQASHLRCLHSNQGSRCFRG